MKSSKEAASSASNNLGQPKVISHGVTWLNDRPSNGNNTDFTRSESEDSSKKGSRKAAGR
jgi:hypothetical protein